MTNFTITKKFSFNLAEQFRESFNEPEPATLGYIFLGDHLPRSNEANVNSIVETEANNKQIWDSMFAGKRVTGNDVEFVVPRINWTSNTKYRQYDDSVQQDILYSSNTSINLKPMYAITSERNVYKCLSNNNSANSTVEPTGTYSTANGEIKTSDGFVWKYMFNVQSSNRFLTDDWIPCPVSTKFANYDVSPTGVVDGAIYSYKVVNQGTGYTSKILNASTFTKGATILTIINVSNLSSNIVNTTITGTGIAPLTHISSVDLGLNQITISKPTTVTTTSTTPLTYSTRILVTGDGSSALALANVVNSNVISVVSTTSGSGYTRANVTVYGTGSNAEVRAIIGPKFGHGFNPARELGANNVMMNIIIGENDSSENSLISTNTSFRQIGLMVNPYKYGDSELANTQTANLVISQAYSVILTAGSNYTVNEKVYQGSLLNPTFYGYVYQNFDATTIKLTNVQGTISTGESLIGENSSISRTVVEPIGPEFTPYSGDILYCENIEKVERSLGQAENIKFVLKF